MWEGSDQTQRNSASDGYSGSKLRKVGMHVGTVVGRAVGSDGARVIGAGDGTNRLTLPAGLPVRHALAQPRP